MTEIPQHHDPKLEESLNGHHHSEQVEQLRLVCQDWPVTHEGVPSKYPTLAIALTTGEYTLPPERVNYDQPQVICVDDGIRPMSPDEYILPYSGGGAGEKLRILKALLPPNAILRAHERCGKAGMVLGEVRKTLRGEEPTAEEIDNYAKSTLETNSILLGLRTGEPLGFLGQSTSLHRPVDLHPGDGAVIGLSRLFPHNLINQELRADEIPVQYKLAGNYYDDFDYHDFAVKEALLVLAIASGDHGIGLVDRGFRYTALIDENDPKFDQLMYGLQGFWNKLRYEVLAQRYKNNPINDVHLDVVGFQSGEPGQPVIFRQLNDLLEI